jgi:hypothetical protein
MALLAMNTKTVFLTVGIAAILALVIAPALIFETASAAIRDACTKNDRTTDGGCTGNTDQNGKTNVRLNPADQAPPGQN